MRVFLAFLFLFACSPPRGGFGGSREEDRSATRPLPSLPRNSPLADLAGVLTDDARDSLSAQLRAFAAPRGIRLQVLTIHSDIVRPQRPMDFATGLFFANHPNKADADSALMLFLFTDLEDCVTFPGSAVRRRMPERHWERADRLLTEAVRRRQYAGGVQRVLELLERQLERK